MEQILNKYRTTMIGGGTWRKWKQKYGNKYGTNIEQIWSVFLEQIWFKYETNMINAEVYWTNMIGGNEKNMKQI